MRLSSEDMYVVRDEAGKDWNVVWEKSTAGDYLVRKNILYLPKGSLLI